MQYMSMSLANFGTTSQNIPVTDVRLEGTLSLQNIHHKYCFNYLEHTFLDESPTL